MTDTHMPPALRFMLAARRSELAGLESLAQTCVLVTSVSQLVHALQRERGYSNVYLGCNDARHLTQLEALSTDARAAEHHVVMCFQDIDLESAAASDRARLFNRLAFVMHALDELPGLRRRIRDQRVSAIDATSMMTRLIGGLLAVVFEAADSAVDPHITRILVALFNFMQGKELAGQERAAGVAGFSAGFFDEQSRSKVEHFVHGQTRCFQTFIEFAQPEAVAIWEAQQASETATQVNRLRSVALKTSQRDRVDATLSQMWFELATLRIDAMRDVETCLTDGLLRRCQASIKQARADLDNHRVLLNRLISLEAAGPAEQAMLFNVQAVELDSPPDEGLGHHLGRSVLDMLQLQTRRLVSANDERDEARQALAERKVVERAKQVLMAEYQLSEGDAYERLRVASMERGQRMLDVSQAVLEKVAVRKNRR